jgi:hypothetical protein
MFVLNQEEGKVELSDAQIKAASIGIEGRGCEHQIRFAIAGRDSPE